MANNANQIFLPWVQPGLADAIPREAEEKLSADQSAVLSLPLRLVVNNKPVAKTAQFYSPADITAIDAQQVVRIEPKHRTTDFEPNYFPAIEFDRPDFPWLFTPLKANAQEQLRPWLCLVVVRKQNGVELQQASDQTLPKLVIADPAKPREELPDLSESHLWAHAQVSGIARNKLGEMIDSSPAQTVSRLLCPRRLDPATDYIACVVPTFEVGRAAGLKETTSATTLLPAWRSGNEAPDTITLPVYYFWEFRTGAGGDFEDLVRRLKRRDLPAEVGRRPMDITQPGFAFDLPSPLDKKHETLTLEGALRVLEREPDAWAEPVRKPFQKALAEILNTPWEIATKSTGTDQEPIVAPPIYGSWHAANHTVAPDQTTATPWLNELNLDPRHRVAGAMGTQVVQEQQEQLMASAWEQLGDIEKINQRLKQAQLSRAVNEKYLTRTFNNFSEEMLLRVVSPAQSQLVISQPESPQPTTALLVQKLARSAVPLTAVSAPLRSLSRPRGAINKKFAQTGTSGIQVMGMLRTFNKPIALGSFASVPPNRGPVTIVQVSNALSSLPPAVLPLNAAQKEMIVKFRFPNLGSEFIRNLHATNVSPDELDAIIKHHQYLERVFPAVTASLNVAMIVPQELKTSILNSLNPASTIRKAVTEGATLKPQTRFTRDDLDPIMDAPEFPQPMYEALRDLSQDFFFPGLEHVPDDTVELLQTNARFIESFMVGLNAEMGRELLWRNYPTDQRGTYFRQFWDTSTAPKDAASDDDGFDIDPIHKWKDRQLGTTVVGPGGDKLVLLIRGELLRRYPGTIIYAVKAMRLNGKRVPAIDHPNEAAGLNIKPPLEAYPMFRGTLEPDVTFVGFNLTDKEVLAGDGWFFVLQQQPTEPRFGLDQFRLDNGQPPKLTTWNDLNRSHLGSNEHLSHLEVRKFQLKPQNDRGTWGRNSAHMAYITKQLPARIAIHASELIHKKQN